MKMQRDLIDENVAWAAVLSRDRAFDGRFVTGVLSTGIYCRPSCAARHPLRGNVRFFSGPDQAIRAGLRACKRCRPEAVARDDAAVVRATEIMAASEDRLKLANLADQVGYSPTHFQRIFKRRTGISPAAYARALRSGKLQQTLAGSDLVTDAIYDAGYSAPSRFYAENEKRLGMTPSIWKNGGAGAVIRWTVIDSHLGPMLVAATEKGVCRLSFNENEAELQARFPKAELVQGGAAFHKLVNRVVKAVSYPADAHDIPLDVRGTAFQEAVWQELQKIPAGETRSYAELAAAVGRPKAYRAAGSANGANNVAVLIPCHRVIASDGSLGGYAYGLDIKRKLLEAEKK